MGLAEGLTVLIAWEDAYASNERRYKIVFEEIKDVKLLINDMKKATRVASKDVNNIISIFTTINFGFGRTEKDLQRYNMDFNDLSMTKIFFDDNATILDPKKESAKFETIYEMVNFVFKDIEKELKFIQKEKKKAKDGK